MVPSVSAEDFICAANTNNGVERQNKAFKYEYLLGNKGCSLTDMLQVLVDQFLPKTYRKQEVPNCKK